MDRMFRILAVLAVSTALSVGRAHAITADSADDVCPATADPCIVTDVVDVVPDSTLDFLNRAVQVTGNGRFDFGAGSGKILSGRFDAATDGDAITAAGPDGSGTVTIEARRLCSAGSSPAACLSSANCQLGACDARRCSARPSLFCTSDASCNGTCNNRRCSNPGTFLRCTTNADCDLGTCPEQLTCRNGVEARNCSANADCNLGSCSIGSGSLTMNGAIDGRSSSPARIILRAADDVTVGAPVDLSGTIVESDGGRLQILAYEGDVEVSGSIRARAGGQGTGGELVVSAEEKNIVLSGPIDLSGGSYDGGSLDASAFRGDLVLLSDVSLSAKSGSGYGGSMSIDAGRDVFVGSGLEPLHIRANGHTDHVEPGEGGELEFFAGRDVHVASGVRIVATGVGPGSSGGYLDIFGEDDVTFDGQFRGRSRSSEGVGGVFEAFSIGDIRAGENSKIDVRGGYGGMVEFESEESDATIGGLARLTGSSDFETGVFQVYGCDVAVSADVINKVTDGYTLLYGRDSLRLLPQARLLAPRGDIFFEYERPERPPIIEGKVNPTAHMQLYDIGGCRFCGNGLLDPWEDCDDGNADDGDGCDSDCAVE